MAGRFVYNLVHFVWSTHERREWIAESWEDDLYAYIGGIARNKNATLLQAGGMPDHLHSLVSLPPTMSISEMVKALKANSSRWVHEDRPELKVFKWQEGYGAFSVSRSSEESVAGYIRRQNASSKGGFQVGVSRPARETRYRLRPAVYLEVVRCRSFGPPRF